MSDGRVGGSLGGDLEYSPTRRKKMEKRAKKQREYWERRTKELNRDGLKPFDWSAMYSDKAPDPMLVDVNGVRVVSGHHSMARR
jgi:hypothetical protein